jgi:hypothetical protein
MRGRRLDAQNFREIALGSVDGLLDRCKRLLDPTKNSNRIRRRQFIEAPYSMDSLFVLPLLNRLARGSSINPSRNPGGPPVGQTRRNTPVFAAADGARHGKKSVLTFDSRQAVGTLHVYEALADLGVNEQRLAPKSVIVTVGTLSVRRSHFLPLAPRQPKPCMKLDCG